MRQSKPLMSWVKHVSLAATSTFMLSAYAKVDKAATFSDMATNLSSQFTAIGQLMTGTAYIAGIGFGIAAIFKFKQHKDNPTQVPIGTPFAMLAISVLLVFLPGLYKPAAKSIYGTTANIGGGFQGAGASDIPGGKDSSGGGPAG